jgi:flagellar hook-length control protein FliK
MPNIAPAPFTAAPPVSTYIGEGAQGQGRLPTDLAPAAAAADAVQPGQASFAGILQQQLIPALGARDALLPAADANNGLILQDFKMSGLNSLPLPTDKALKEAGLATLLARASTTTTLATHEITTESAGCMTGQHLTDELAQSIQPVQQAEGDMSIDETTSIAMQSTAPPVLQPRSSTALDRAQTDADTDAAQAPTELAALLAFFTPPVNTSVQAIDVPAERRAMAANAFDISGASLLPNPGSLTPANGTGFDPRTNLPQDAALPAAEIAAPATASTASTAATLATAAEPAATGSTSGINEAGFDTLLGAAQAQLSQQTHASTHPARSGSDPIRLETPVGARGWDQEVGDKLVWMSNRQEQRAELVLNPPQLGRVEVSLSLSGDQTNASFVAVNPAVREALESALPRLREMFAEAGLSLGNTQVGSDSSSSAFNPHADKGENRPDSMRYSATREPQDEGNIALLTGARAWSGQGRGLIDTFA